MFPRVFEFFSPLLGKLPDIRISHMQGDQIPTAPSADRFGAAPLCEICNVQRLTPHVSEGDQLVA